MASSTFFQVDLELIRTDAPLDFSLYMSTPETGRVMFVQAGQAVTQDVKLRMARTKAGIFILQKDRDRYRSHLQDGLHQLIRTEPVDETKAATLAYDLSLQAVETVFDNPDKETLEQADGAFQATAELILSKERALFALLELTRNSLALHVHSCNVAIFGLGLAKSLLAEGVEINLKSLSSALFFHDLGQISTDPALLGRTEGLTEEEEARVREHPAIGLELLGEAGFLSPEAEAVIFQHHERLDGSGYPKGLKAGEIDLLARICAIADTYDMLTTDRPDQKGLEGPEAALHMAREMTGQFDPDLLRRFIQMFRQG